MEHDSVADVDLAGSWRLVEWRRIAGDGSVSFPLGQDAQGLLIYAPDGHMAVVLTAGGRPPIEGNDPLGGDERARADAYSTCLAYAGTYQRTGDTVVHTLEESLYPNWTGTLQSRPIGERDGNLVLSTPPQTGPSAGTVNEIVWSRASAPSDDVAA